MKVLTNALNSYFKPGKGLQVYTCRNCGRSTRPTGGRDNEHVQLCAQCYELAGLENALADAGELTAADKSAANRYLTELSKFVGDKAFTLHPELTAAIRPTQGVDINAADRDNKAVAKIAQKAPVKTVQHASRPRILKGAKANKAVEPVRFFIIFDNQVIESIALSDIKAAERYAAERYANPCLVQSEADYYATNKKLPKSGPALKAKQDAARAKAAGATGAIIPADPKDKAAVKAEKRAQREAAKQTRLAAAQKRKELAAAAKAAKGAKVAKKAPAAKKSQPSWGMLVELIACAFSKPTQDKKGSCMRMHLKMRGLIADHKTGALTTEGFALLDANGTDYPGHKSHLKPGSTGKANAAPKKSKK